MKVDEKRHRSDPQRSPCLAVISRFAHFRADVVDFTGIWSNPGIVVGHGEQRKPGGYQTGRKWGGDETVDYIGGGNGVRERVQSTGRRRKEDKASLSRVSIYSHSLTCRLP